MKRHTKQASIAHFDFDLVEKLRSFLYAKYKASINAINMYKPTRLWGHYPLVTGLRCKVSDNFAVTQNYYQYPRQVQLIIRELNM
mgnify:CR=1 FL=1